MSNHFWEEKAMEELTKEEWESLCGQCGWCCVEKLRDPETDKIHFTRVACRWLNLKKGLCRVYKNRTEVAGDCQTVYPLSEKQERLLPPFCAYRTLKYTGKLPDWHYLITGSKKTVQEQGISVIGRLVKWTEMIDPEDYIVYEME